MKSMALLWHCSGLGLVGKRRSQKLKPKQSFVMQHQCTVQNCFDKTLEVAEQHPIRAGGSSKYMWSVINWQHSCKQLTWLLIWPCRSEGGSNVILVYRNMSPELQSTKRLLQRGCWYCNWVLPLTGTVVILALQQCLHQKIHLSAYDTINDMLYHRFLLA